MPASLQDVERDQDMWFEDGNIIVVAQKTAFRFHRGTLSRHSEIFRGLFSVPQPLTPDNVTMDGCPVISVSDSSYDFKLLLRVIYDGVRFFAQSGPMEFSELASLVRMGHKYAVEPALEESLRRLRSVYTTDIAAWNEHQHKGTSLVSLCREDAIEAINLIRLVGDLDMLPSAFLACARLTMSEISIGSLRADGTLETLSTLDLQLALEGRTTLVKYDAQLAALFFKPPLPESCTCPSLEERSSVIATNWDLTLTSFPRILDADVLNLYFPDMANGFVNSGQLCRSCGDAMIAHHRSLKQRLWNSLPSVFGLLVPGWGSM